MRTTLSPEALAKVHAEGMLHTSRFVNPHTIAHVKALLRERGEEWAASVLLRPLAERSRACPALPALREGEEEVLVAAYHAEMDQLREALQ